jgi:hypothetical protein
MLKCLINSKFEDDPRSLNIVGSREVQTSSLRLADIALPDTLAERLLRVLVGQR